MAMFLLFRSADHLVLGIDWAGMTVSAGDPPVLVAGDGARIVLTFPPQHVAEQTSAPGAVPPSGTWSGRVARPSRLAFSIATGARIPLTIDGILAGLHARPVLVAGPDASALEIPAGLTIIPSAVGAAGIQVLHSGVPRPAAGVTGVWRTSLRPDDDGPIAVRAVAADPMDPPFDVPLPAAQRRRLVSETATGPAIATRLELTTLGGALDVAGHWPNFDWEHHCVLGRDMLVRTISKGVLYPFGHRAVYSEFTIRSFDSSGVAALRTERVLTVSEPVRDTPPGAVRRGFPFPRVELATRRVTGVQQPQWQTHTFPTGTRETHFWPVVTGADGTPQRAQFKVRAETFNGEVRFALPLVYVNDLSPSLDSLGDRALAAQLAAFYQQVSVPLPAVTIDLVGPSADFADDARPGDFHEVHGIVVAASAAAFNAADGYRAGLSGLVVNSPALRTLLDDDTNRSMRLGSDYLRGQATDVLLEIVPEDVIDVDFTKRADRTGGLVSPRYVADALSRGFGPVNRRALLDHVTGKINPRTLFDSTATILGFPIVDLLGEVLDGGPAITAGLTAGGVPEVKMTWKGVKLHSTGGLIAAGDALLDLTVTQGPVTSETDCVLGNFALEFPPADPALRVSFRSVHYHQINGLPPTLRVSGVTVEFLGNLKIVEKIKDVVDIGKAAELVTVSSKAVVVHYSYAAPPVTSGAFAMRNIAMSFRLTVPFDTDPPTLELGFCSRTNPFQLAVLMFGGTGYAQLVVSREGLAIEAALEFGALAVVDFVIASAEVHVLGGVRFTLAANGSVTVTGYLRIGGSVDILGLISVSIELRIELAYVSARNALIGRATLVIEIDLTLWSDTMELDSGEWVLAGAHTNHALDRAMSAADVAPSDHFADWVRYRSAFRPDEHDDALADQIYRNDA